MTASLLQVVLDAANYTLILMLVALGLAIVFGLMNVINMAHGEFMMSGPIVAIIASGNRVIEGFRSLAGATDPTVAAPGTIRGDLARDQGTKVMQNLVHGSDSPESAAREIQIFFPK